MGTPDRGPRWGRSPALSAAVVLCAVLLLLLPVPGPILDGLLLANLLGGAALLLACARAGHPRRLPQLPSLLILGMVLRLGLLLGSLRLLLTAGEAGWAAGAAGEVVLGGDLAISGALLLCLLGVQYLVVARGGERVAEVAARFALDALPGQQAAIDADLRAGSLPPEAAQARRAALLREAQIYGALDGALRFVRGDAAAALVVLALGLLGGLVVGAREGLSLEASLQRYALPLGGIGVLTQVPALLQALAAGLLLSRGEGDGGDGEAAAQAAAEPALVVEAGEGLALDEAALSALARAVEAELGLPLPPVALRPAGPGRRLRLQLRGAPLPITEVTAQGELAPGAEPAAVLGRALRGAAPELLGLDEVQALLLRLGAQRPALLRETVPRRAELPLLCQLLRRLLAERVLPLDLRAVLEALAQVERPATDPALLCEQVRAHLGPALLRGLTGDAGLRAVVIEPEIEDALREAPAPGRGADHGLEPEIVDELLAAAAVARAQAPGAALLCNGEVRRRLAHLLRVDPDAQPVLGYGELPPRLPVSVVGRLGPGGFALEEG